MHWEDPEGWDGEGGGRGESGWGTHVNPWLIHVNVWQKPLQYCKVTSLQLIKINGKKINSKKKELPTVHSYTCVYVYTYIKGMFLFCKPEKQSKFSFGSIERDFLSFSKFLKFLFVYFIFGCTESPLLHVSFL